MARMSCPSAQSWKLTFRVLGACASLAFLLQDIWIFQHPRTENLWRFCNWIGQALLFLFAGAAGLCLEYRGGVSSVAAHSARFAFNRVSLSLFYFWLGCYVQGFDADGAGQEVLARFTGVLAWVVCIGDLFIACLGATQEPAEAKQNLPREKEGGGTTPSSAAAASPDAAAGATPGPPASQGSQPPREAEDLEAGRDNPFADSSPRQAADPAPPPAEQPGQNWNSLGARPFGAA